MGASKRLRVIDLFCGAGGLSLGFSQAGLEIVYALDKDRDSCDTYRSNHPSTTVDCLPIDRISPDEIASKVGGRIDVIVGGPSCQGFSTAGRKTGWVREDDDRNQLWSHMLGLVKRLEPRAFLLENVPGLIYWKEGHFGHKILEQFQKAGYTVAIEILLAADFGVPQVRRRVFMVGLRGKTKFQFPSPTHLGAWRRDTIELWERERRKRRLLRHISCWEAIGDLPVLGRSLGGDTTILGQPGPLTPYAKLMRGRAGSLHDHQVSALADEHLNLVRLVPQGGTWRDIPPHQLPDRFYGMRRTDSSTLLGRLDPYRPAYTITTQFNNPTAGCFVHPWEDRVLSIREGARLQSFPDDYRFMGGTESRYRQVGNAVPPLLARVLATALVSRLSRQASHNAKIEVKAVKPMAPPPSPIDPVTGRRMRAQKRIDTRPEILLRHELHLRGMRFRIGTKPVQGLRREVDICFPSARVAVFVDGCFWHGCPSHARPTKAHTLWWADKIKANKKRDAKTTKILTGLGWTVIRVWEHQTPKDAADLVESVVHKGGVKARPRADPHQESKIGTAV
jgi:DNA (cytosine-5)-methyltransferase 1